MKITIEVTPTNAATLRAMARQEDKGIVEYIEAMLDLKAGIHRLCAPTRRAMRRCSCCKTLDFGTPDDKPSRNCGTCGKRLNAQDDDVEKNMRRMLARRADKSCTVAS